MVDVHTLRKQQRENEHMESLLGVVIRYTLQGLSFRSLPLSTGPFLIARIKHPVHRPITKTTRAKN